MNKELGFLVLRLLIGTNLLGSWMTETFASSPLPSFLVHGFGTVLPTIELTTGILLILGLWTRVASLVGALVMISLIFGSCLIQNWEWVGMQMVYGIYFVALLFLMEHNHISLDTLIFKRNAK